MKVKDLKAVLDQLDPETDVILQRDSEGNGYSPLAAWGMATYVPDTGYSGEAFDDDWTAEDCAMEEDEYEEMRKNPLALILAPAN